jgi:DNA-binding IclR family transcriptional regulator
MKRLRVAQTKLDRVAGVLALLEHGVGTIEEVIERSRLDVGSIREILEFFDDFGLVRTEGSRIVVDPRLLGLPEA